MSEEMEKPNRSFATLIKEFEYPGAEGRITRSKTLLNDSNTTMTLTRSRKRSFVESEAPTGSQNDPISFSTPTPSDSRKQKKRRPSSKYAPPSRYAHLTPLTDVLEPGLICVFVGFNPGVQTATTGHAYAHPSNSFWKLLHSSGCTDRRCRPEEDRDLPRLYSMGNTNLVSRPTKDTAELSKEEQIASVPILDAKIGRVKPEAVCIVGKSIWENIWRYRHGKNMRKEEFRYGWQDEAENMGLIGETGAQDAVDFDDGGPWKGAKVFVATSTSGLSATLKPAEKAAIWQPFGKWVAKRREERAREAERA